jgi:hypothetical protein
MSQYAHETAKPELPHCGKAQLSLRFSGSHVVMTGRKIRVFTAASGKQDTKGKFDYSVDRQKLKGQGPIPAGEYWINFEDLWTNAWWKRGSQQAWGNYRITIRVFPGTKTYDRGGFFVHGGGILGSAGCIDLSLQMDAFVEALREELEEEKPCYIPLTVTY